MRGPLCSCCDQGPGDVRIRADVLRLAADHPQQTTWQDEPEAPGVHPLRPPWTA